MKTKKSSILFGNVNDPIITSLLEVDTYKFLMAYFYWVYARDVNVKFAFTNRTKKIQIGPMISIARLRDELMAVGRLRFTEMDITYLRKKGIFSESFLVILRDLRLNQPIVALNDHGQYDITVEGAWYVVTFWETMILAVVNQLYAESVIGYDRSTQDRVITEGERRLREKSMILRDTNIRFLQFGLRRRLSGWWEEHITRLVQQEMPENMIAVSNVALAKKIGVSWGGTNAHELYSGFSALCDDDRAMRMAQYDVLEKWMQLYPEDLRIMLPDTFGSEQFFDGLPQKIAHNFRGARQDSGDPVRFGNMLLARYAQMGIDPQSKVLLFSDGLNVAEMMRLQDLFCNKTTVRFGWGTNLTNDTGALLPISIVMKLIEANGRPAVKLSDNVAKAIGTDSAVERAKRVYRYTNTFSEACVY